MKPAAKSTEPQATDSGLPMGPAMDRPTILAIRLRVIELYEALQSNAEKWAAVNPRYEMCTIGLQVQGMRQVRMMLGQMLDEQAGLIPPVTPLQPAIDPELRIKHLEELVTGAAILMRFFEGYFGPSWFELLDAGQLEYPDKIVAEAESIYRTLHANPSSQS